MSPIFVSPIRPGRSPVKHDDTPPIICPRYSDQRVDAETGCIYDLFVAIVISYNDKPNY